MERLVGERRRSVGRWTGGVRSLLSCLKRGLALEFDWSCVTLCEGCLPLSLSFWVLDCRHIGAVEQLLSLMILLLLIWPLFNFEKFRER